MVFFSSCFKFERRIAIRHTRNLNSYIVLFLSVLTNIITLYHFYYIVHKLFDVSYAYICCCHRFVVYFVVTLSMFCILVLDVICLLVSCFGFMSWLGWPAKIMEFDSIASFDDVFFHYVCVAICVFIMMILFPIIQCVRVLQVETFLFGKGFFGSEIFLHSALAIRLWNSIYTHYVSGGRNNVWMHWFHLTQ